jgi:hypothetical protein
MGNIKLPIIDAVLPNIITRDIVTVLKDVGNKSITIVTTIFPQTPPNDKNIDANVTTVNEFWEKYIDIAQIPLTMEKVLSRVFFSYFVYQRTGY